ncbi:phage portal protein [Mesorhizobium sp. M1B.F.Ca.ET.045.04.1.1]|uniref:phage portal protein n=1 Tax=Mesorhizobium sp. M1B.F.Ca.ET.045.04.1.1 TaxID=2493673 RepID=UPI000F7602B5|nr:phage portal protein [Mesorhizobium sp. M1B.F.Ca.ET.045.04.1.1]AZO29416.1 phage portal protein [Mesorhizobium sp. M1B.F.Ca.ET.045.04.1.1]
MSDVEETAVVPTESRQMDLIVKDHGTEMTMAEFASWLGENIGSASVQNALKQAAFMLCCDVIAQDIAKSTLRLRERMKNGTSRVVLPTEHPIAGFLALEPNRRHTWNEFTEMMVLWECYTSNAYAGVLRNRTDDPLELIPFQTGRVRELVEGRDIFYDVVAGTMQEQALLGAVSMTFHERDMIHVRGRMVDGMDGYSTLTAGRDVLDTGKAIDGFRTSLFSEEGQLRGVFKKSGEGALDELAFQRLRSQLKILMKRFKAGVEPVVLEDNMEFQAIASKPMEMELTKQFAEQINQTCRLLRVPPHKVFHFDGAKYENLETAEKMYVGDSLVPRAERFEHRYGKVLLSRADRLRFFFEYDRDEMTLRDSQRETERIKTLLERGAIEIDEARAMQGFNPLPNGQGEVRLIPVNMQAVDRDGNVVIAASSTIDPNAPAPDQPADAKAQKGA